MFNFKLLKMKLKLFFSLSLALFLLFGFGKLMPTSRKTGCIYFQPSVSNGVLTDWNPSNGSFTAYPTCPKCGTRSATGLMGGEGVSSGKEEISGYCVRYDCKPKGEITYNYTCFVTWPSPKCD
jgi:hypothetical protein